MQQSTSLDIKNASKGKTKSLFSIIHYLKPYKYMLLGVLASLVITSGSVLFISTAIKFFIDAGIAGQNVKMLNEALRLLISIISILALFTFCRFWLISFVGERVVADIRRDVYKHLLNLSPIFFENNRTGDILSRLTADTTILLTIIGSSLSVALRNIIILIGGFFVLAATSPALTVMILIIVPIIIFPIIYLGRKLRVYSRNSQDRIAELTSISEETISAIRTIQAYRREKYEITHYNKKVQEQIRTSQERITIRGLLGAMVIVFAFSGVAFVLWIGGHQVLNNEISPGELSAFIYVAVICAGSLAALSDVVGDVQRAAGATERLFEFLRTKPAVSSPSAPKKLPYKNPGNIEFKNVTFRYDKQNPRPTLNNISFSIEPGKVTALVGKSGAGKSTTFALLERFYDIDEGEILFDGVNIKKLDLSDLRGQLTYVPQDSAIFSTTIYENIAFGNPNATFAEIKAAADAAACMGFIEKLPNGFKTHIGEKGVKLSGGQKQRISIARAILHDPKILLLDEATSSLDSKNENLVQKALENLMRNRTTIVIAHRLSTVKNADQIIVFDAGKIVEVGTHNKLMKKKNGYYRELAELQFNFDSYS